MIERFNFYDIYGYLLPGATLVGLLWLPFGIITGTWPAAQLSEAVFVLGFSYVVGHVLQTIASKAVPSKVSDRKKNMRYPSDLILDPDDKKLASGVKSKLQEYVEKEFAIDLRIGEVSTGSDEISSNRVNAFFLCRGLLIRQKIANYAEQFEGLYAMQRGLSVAFCVGAFYLAGWGCSLAGSTIWWFGPTSSAFLLIGSGGVLVRSLLSVRRGPFHPNSAARDRWLLPFLLAAVFGFGVSFGMNESRTASHLSVFWISALCALVASARCYSGYKEFTLHFSTAVWRDFVSFKSQTPEPPNPSGSAPSYLAE